MPDTRYIIGGYSQGADVAGDLAASISNDLIPGVTTDDVAATVLYADPDREALSNFDGYSGEPASLLYTDAPQGVMGRNLETVAGYLPEGNPKYVGLAGGRDLDFLGMQGKVLSLCHPKDPACAAPPNGMLPAVADFADHGVSGDSLKDAQTYEVLTEFLRVLNESGAPAEWAAGNHARAGELTLNALMDSPIGAEDFTALATALEEVAGVALLVWDEYDEQLSFLQLLGVIGLAAVPQLVDTALSELDPVGALNTMFTQLQGIGVDAGLLQQWRNIVNENADFIVLGRAAFDIPFVGDLLRGVVNDLVNGLTGVLADWFGVADFMDSPAYDALFDDISALTGFVYHGAYWDDHIVGRVSSATYANNWAADAAEGVMNETSFYYEATGNLTPTLEIGIEEELDQQAPNPSVEEPSTDPTTEPTADPTTEPSIGPSADPSSEPSADPTTDPAPTADPSVDPSVEPIVDRTDVPTEAVEIAIPRMPVDVNGLNTVEIPAADGSSTVVDISDIVAGLPGDVASILLPDDWKAELDLDSNLLYVEVPEGETLNGRIALTSGEGADADVAELLLVQNDDIAAISGPAPGRDLLAENILVGINSDSNPVNPGGDGRGADRDGDQGDRDLQRVPAPKSKGGLVLTGAQTAPLIGLGTLLLLAGIGAVLVARKRTSMK